MSQSKKSLEFEVHPLWKFIQNSFGMEEAFRMFGPYRGANIMPSLIDDYTYEVQMPLVLSNTNYLGVHFGGSLYSMCDPFFMFLLMRNLGEDYMVWDKSAKIDFLKTGKGTVKVKFHIPQSEIDAIKEILLTQKKIDRFYEAEVIDDDGSIVARVHKTLYIRKLKKEKS